MRAKIYGNRFKVYNDRSKYYRYEESKTVILAIQADVSLTSTDRFYADYIVGMEINEGVWVKNKAFYGMLGGTAATHRWNWKDMRDLDVAYRITWNGGITHSSSGIQGNGTTGYGDTKFRADLTFTNTSYGVSFYTKGIDGTTTSGSITGAQYAQGMDRIWRVMTFFSGIGFLGDLSVSNNTGYRGMFGDGNGFYSLNRTALNTMNLNWSGITYPQRTGVNNDNLIGLNNTLYILAQNNTTITGVNSPTQFYSKPVSFMAYHEGLTQQEASQMSHIITFAQGILGRQ